MTPPAAAGGLPTPGPEAASRHEEKEISGPARLPASYGERSLFPLPKVFVRGELHRRRRDRDGRHVHRLAVELNRLVEALNWLHGCLDRRLPATVPYPLSADLDYGVTDPVRFGVLARLDGAVRGAECEAPLDPQTALRQLLRGRSPYDVRSGAMSLAPSTCGSCHCRRMCTVVRLSTTCCLRRLSPT